MSPVVLVVGITGVLASGKSTAARMLGGRGAVVWNADAEVHRLYGFDRTVIKQIRRIAPEAVGASGGVDRARLSRAIQNDPSLLGRVQAVVYPPLNKARTAMLKRARRQRRSVVVLDVPLLFEEGVFRHCGWTVCVTAPEFLARQRALRRGNFTREKWLRMTALQWPQRRKVRACDCVVPSGAGLRVMRGGLRCHMRRAWVVPKGLRGEGGIDRHRRAAANRRGADLRRGRFSNPHPTGGT